MSECVPKALTDEKVGLAQSLPFAAYGFGVECGWDLRAVLQTKDESKRCQVSWLLEGRGRCTLVGLLEVKKSAGFRSRRKYVSSFM